MFRSVQQTLVGEGVRAIRTAAKETTYTYDVRIKTIKHLCCYHNSFVYYIIMVSFFLMCAKERSLYRAGLETNIHIAHF